MRFVLAVFASAILAMTGCSVQGGPDSSARSWMEAFASGDGLRLGELTCDSAQQQLQGEMLGYSAIGLLSSMFLGGTRPQVSVDELAYDTLRDDGETADVRVSGRIRVAVMMSSSAQPLNAVFHMRFERADWRLCGSNSFAGS